MRKHVPFEALIWICGLSALAMWSGETHFTLCPLKNAGLDICPGCGLGRSIALLFHGEFAASLRAHPLGLFAVIVLSFRIVNLTKQYFRSYGKNY